MLAARRLTVAGLFALALFTSAVAHADAPLADSLTGEAKASYEAGKLLLGDHDYAGAATKFRAAYDASHDPRLLWNMAACEKELRHYARASGLVDQFLTDAVGHVPPEGLDQARATQKLLREFFSLVPVKVEPTGATLLIDGSEVGHAPFAAPVAIDLGEHVVRVEQAGFTPFEAHIVVTGQATAPIEATLTVVAQEALLAVNPADPADVVAVDDGVVGSGHWEGALPAGKHRVRVTAQGKRAYLLELELGAGEHRSLDVTLENDKKALWPWVVGGGTVVVIGAVVGGYFLFKPSDSLGPAPSGKLGTVFVGSALTRVGR